MLLFQINDELWSLIFLLIILFPVGVLLLLLMRNQRKRDKARTEGLQEIAKKMGLNFSPKGSQRLHNHLARFKFASRRTTFGVSFWITNLIEGNTGKINISIFNVRHGVRKKTRIVHIYCCDRKLSCARNSALSQDLSSTNLTMRSGLAGMTSTLINIRSSPIAF